MDVETTIVRVRLSVDRFVVAKYNRICDYINKECPSRIKRRRILTLSTPLYRATRINRTTTTTFIVDLYSQATGVPFYAY